MHSRRGIFFAPDQDEGVLMDLNRGTYLGIDAVGTRIWMGMEAGLSVEKLAGEVAFASPNPTRLVVRQIEAWRVAGLVAEGREADTDTLPRSRKWEVATRDIAKGWIGGEPLSTSSLIRIVHANVCTKLSMRFTSLPATLQRLQQVEARTESDAAKSAELVRRTLRAYRATRMLFLEGAKDCLPRSIALALALRRQGVDAVVCVGVHKFPFAAHAWVQQGDCVLSDPLDYTQRFALIAAF
jgi:hypothetical protein